MSGFEALAAANLALFGIFSTMSENGFVWQKTSFRLSILLI
jgi:hypothetical protein